MFVRSRSFSFCLFYQETHYTYTPSDARAARPLCCDDVRAERVPWVCGVHEGLRGALGVHDAQWIFVGRSFRTAKAAERGASKNSLHKLKRNSDMPSSNEDLSES